MGSQNARFFSYRNTASLIISRYDYKNHFGQHLKSFFRQFPKYGSRDRKTISDLCYGFLRIGRSTDELELNDQLNIGFFLTHQADNGYLEVVSPAWVQHLGGSINQKCNFLKSLYPSFDPLLIFPFGANLSEGINRISLAFSMLGKPSFFIRVRPGQSSDVRKKLEKASVSFLEVTDNCFEIQGQVDIGSIVSLNKECVVQDISSQKTSFLFSGLNNEPMVCWDACAASGGKSIMFHDHFPLAKIHVSDLRESILVELQKRFHEAGMSAESIFQVDLTSASAGMNIKQHIPDSGVDVIIADVPCSGSGTWGRDPEWLRRFHENELAFFQKRQVEIIRSIIPYLKTGGHLIYITCSVFRSENEDVLEQLEKTIGLHRVESRMISGLGQGGDHLFASLLTL